MTAVLTCLAGSTFASSNLGASPRLSPGLLLHRWSFNDGMNDSVGTANAEGTGVQLTDAGEVYLPGGKKDTAFVSLGSNPIPSTLGDTPFTIELWTKPVSVDGWRACFWLGANGENNKGLAFVFKHGRYPGPYFKGFGGTILSTNDISHLSSGNCVLGETMLSSNTYYHVALTVTPDGSGSGATLVAYIHTLDGKLFVTGSATYSDWTTAQLDQSVFWLGQSCYDDDSCAHAYYDEVRVWRTALTKAQIEANIALGPDVLPDTTFRVLLR